MVTDFGLIATKSFILKAWVLESREGKTKEELIWSVSNEGTMLYVLLKPPCPWTQGLAPGQGQLPGYANCAIACGPTQRGIPGLVQCPVVPILIVLILFLNKGPTFSLCFWYLKFHSWFLPWIIIKALSSLLSLPLPPWPQWKESVKC